MKISQQEWNWFLRGIFGWKWSNDNCWIDARRWDRCFWFLDVFGWEFKASGRNWKQLEGNENKDDSSPLSYIELFLQFYHRDVAKTTNDMRFQFEVYCPNEVWTFFIKLIILRPQNRITHKSEPHWSSTHSTSTSSNAFDQTIKRVPLPSFLINSGRLLSHGSPSAPLAVHSTRTKTMWKHSFAAISFIFIPWSPSHSPSRYKCCDVTTNQHWKSPEKRFSTFPHHKTFDVSSSRFRFGGLTVPLHPCAPLPRTRLFNFIIHKFQFHKTTNGTI